MIVLDEQLNDSRIFEALEKWYKGKVIHVKELRPKTLVDDDNIAALLLSVKQPTFITINYKDFWKVIPAHQNYCIICFNLKGELTLEIPNLLREIFKNPELKTKRARMGKVVSVRGVINWYSVETK